VEEHGSSGRQFITFRIELTGPTHGSPARFNPFPDSDSFIMHGLGRAAGPVLPPLSDCSQTAPHTPTLTPLPMPVAVRPVGPGQAEPRPEAVCTSTTVTTKLKSN
jgi:hypothetical protein